MCCDIWLGTKCVSVQLMAQSGPWDAVSHCAHEVVCVCVHRCVIHLQMETAGCSTNYSLLPNLKPCLILYTLCLSDGLDVPQASCCF